MKPSHSFLLLLAWAWTAQALTVPLGYHRRDGPMHIGPVSASRDQRDVPPPADATSTSVTSTGATILTCTCTSTVSTNTITMDAAVATTDTSTPDASTTDAATIRTSVTSTSTSRSDGTSSSITSADSTSRSVASTSSPSSSSDLSSSTPSPSSGATSSATTSTSTSSTISKDASSSTTSSTAEATPTPGVINFDINLTNGGGLTRSVAYMASIKLANDSSDKESWVQLDTGSSDLWIQVDDLPVKENSYDKDPELNITHGQSSVTGNMSYASVTFAGFSIEKQLLLQANNSFNFGAQGILGLGFDANSSLVSQYMADHNLDHKGSLTLMTNIINQDFTGNKGPGFITLDVNRSPDVEASQMIFNNKDAPTIGGGTLTIGSVLPGYESAMDSAPHLSVPQNLSDSEDTGALFDFWHVPVDSVAFGEQKYNVGADGRADGTTTALIDSGSSLSFVSQSLAYFIYSNIENSAHCEKEGSKTNVLWLVPCTSTPHVSFTFGGQDIRIDPLALTDVVQLQQEGSDHVACIGTFRAHDTPSGLDEGTPYNYTLGDPFLRNVYTRFDYGSATTDNDFTDPPTPFISFVSKVNGTDDTINANFMKTRGQTLQFFADKKMIELQPDKVNCDNLAAYYL